MYTLDEKIKRNPDVVIQSACESWYFYEYLNAVLDHFQNQATTIHSWPDRELGLTREVPKTAKFYNQLEKWFLNQNIKVIFDNNSRRFLPTFVKLAGYPPRLGFEKIIKGLLSQCHWDDLESNTEDEIVSYAQKYNNRLTVFEKDITTENSNGFYVLKELIVFLSDVKKRQKDNKNLEAVVEESSKKNGIELNRALNIVNNYKAIIEKEGTYKTRRERLSISFRIDIDDKYENGELFLHTNLTSTGIKSNVILPPEMAGTLSFSSEYIDNNTPYRIYTKKIDNISRLKTETSTPLSFRVKKLHHTLRQFSIFFEGRDDNGFNQVRISHIDRNWNCLLFNPDSGQEYTDSNVQALKNSKVMILPLSKELNDELKSLVERDVLDFQVLSSSLIAYVTKSDNPIKIEKFDISINFVDTPISIEFGDQTSYERGFGRHIYFLHDLNFRKVSQNYTNCSLHVFNSAENEVAHLSSKRIEGVLKFPVPGKYRIRIIKNDTCLVYEQKIKILPIIDLSVIRNELNITLFQNWTMKLNSSTLKNTQSERTNQYVWKGEYGINTAAFSFFHINNLKIHGKSQFNIRKEVQFLISGESIENDSINDIQTISADSFIFFDPPKSNKDKEYIVEFYTGSSHLRFPEMWSISIIGKKAFSLSHLWEKIKRDFLNRVIIQIKSGNKKISHIEFKRNIIPLNRTDSYISEMVDRTIDGFRVFNLLSLMKEPETVNGGIWEPQKPGLYLVYGVKLIDHDDEYHSISDEELYLSNSEICTDVEFFVYKKEKLNSLSPYQEAIINLNPQEPSGFERMRNLLPELLSNKEEALNLYQSLRNIEKWGIANDFLIYSLVLENCTYLASWDKATHLSVIS